MTGFHLNGKLSLAWFARTEEIQGVSCLESTFLGEMFWGKLLDKGSAGVRFHNNGKLARCMAAREVTIQGQTFRKRDHVSFDREGKLVPETTPLHQAVQSGDGKAVSTLLLSGVDPNVRNPWGSTPLHHALWAHAVDRCSAADLERTIELLVAHDADVNALHPTEGTPLDYALKVAPDTVCELLRRHGAKISDDLQ